MWLISFLMLFYGLVGFIFDTIFTGKYIKLFYCLAAFLIAIFSLKWEKNKTYFAYTFLLFMCNVVMNIGLIIYYLVDSKVNLGLTYIFIVRSSFGFLTTAYLLICTIFSFVLYKLGDKKNTIEKSVNDNRDTRDVNIQDNNNKKNIFTLIKEDIRKNIRSNFIYFISYVLLIVCLCPVVQRVKLANYYEQEIDAILEDASLKFQFSGGLEKQPGYEGTALLLDSDDVAVDCIMKLKAAYYNGAYGTDFDLNNLDEYARTFAGNVTEDLDLYKFGTFVFTDFLYCHDLYSIDVYSDKEDKLRDYTGFIINYEKLVENNSKIDNRRSICDNLTLDEIENITNLYFGKDGDLMKRDLMYRRFLNIEYSKCNYNQDGYAVKNGELSIDKVRTYIQFYFAFQYDKRYIDYINEEDINTNILYEEYDMFCKKGDVEECKILDELYNDFMQPYGRSEFIDNVVYVGNESDDMYGYVKSYIETNTDMSIEEFNNQKELSEDDYRLLRKACDTYIIMK